MKKIYIIFIIHFLFVSALQAQHQPIDSVLQSIVQQREENISKIHKQLGKLSYDTIVLRKMASLSQKNHYPIGEIYAYNSLGKIYRINTNFSKAIYYHQKALDLATETGNLYFQIYSLNMIGVVYRRMDAVKSALEYHNKALQLALNAPKQTNSILHNIAISHNSIGNIYLLLERDDLALIHFQKALKIEETFDNKLGLAINYQNIGSILRRNGDLKQALYYYRKSLDYNNRINSKVGKIICNTSIANVYLDENNPDKALQILLPNLPLAKELGDNYYLSDVYISLGKVYNKMGQYTKAASFLQKGLDISLSKGIPSEASEAYKQFSILKEKERNYKQALVYHKKFTEEQNKILNKKNRQLVADLVIKQLKQENKQKLQALDQKKLIVEKKLTQAKKSLYLSLLLFLLISVLGLLLYYRYKLKNQNKLVNMEQNLLRAQMNPHFIFNSLNSIKLFIIQNRPKDAVMYLGKFAKFVRSILQSTFEKEMTLQEEIDTMKLYVEIENTRFSDHVQFDVQVDNGLTPAEISIPPLLTQPFIENALWHGLSLKEDDKQLRIKISKLDALHFLIEITDNGVGRKKAMEIKAARTFKRESVGIKLSKERLVHFSKKFKGQGDIKIIDLYDESGKPLGTKIEIIVPMK